MAFLTPDKTITATIGGKTLTIKQKITPDGAKKPDGSKVKPDALLAGTGKAKGVTVHNTDDIKAAAGTNAAEQYARATYPNCNMKDVAVHFWVWRTEIWQQLKDTERGWHAADGNEAAYARRGRGRASTAFNRPETPLRR